MENIEKNKFFEKAKERASNVLNNNSRLRSLLQNANTKLSDIDVEDLKKGKFIGRIRIMMRMIRAYRKGLYNNIPWQTMVLLVAALIYFVTPIDVVPDFIPLTGLLDDFTVIVWVYNKMQQEIDNFLLWENEQLNVESN